MQIRYIRPKTCLTYILTAPLKFMWDWVWTLAYQTSSSGPLPQSSFQNQIDIDPKVHWANIPTQLYVTSSFILGPTINMSKLGHWLDKNIYHNQSSGCPKILQIFMSTNWFYYQSEMPSFRVNYAITKREGGRIIYFFKNCLFIRVVFPKILWKIFFDVRSYEKSQNFLYFYIDI